MSPLLIGPIFEFGKAILDRFIEDPTKKRDAEMEMFRMAAEGDMKQVLAQLEINAREAQHPSLLVSGGRPAFMWIGAFGFAYATIIQPLLAWYSEIKGFPVPPDINVDLLWVVITGLLGIGGLRSIEKVKGATK